MLPSSKTLRYRRGKRSAFEEANFRETPMTQPEPRYYKEVFRPAVNIRDFKGQDPISHVAPDPDTNPRGDATQHARMMKSSVQMYPTERDKDTFTAPAKKSNAAQSQFLQSDALYGTAPPRPAQKKLSAVKVAEIGGSGTVEHLNYD